ncbi:C2H2 transcription factor, partial [Aspergillus sp. HF37]
ADFTVVIRSSKLGLAQLASWAAPMRPNQPSTGKPCNSIFSRPYDLTRHEDTIHNARKQKVRCHLCTEEKTFSRNDALTRHMRVVHPDVDWVGKQKRKNQK